MTRLLPPVKPGSIARAALLVAAAAALGSCGSSTNPAATVDGTVIRQQDVVDELEAIRANGAYVGAIEGAGARVLGEEDDAFDSAFVATQLGVRIQYAIVGNEVDRRELRADDECRQAARDSLEQRFVTPDAEGAELLGGFPDDYVDYLVDRESDFLLLQGDLVGQPCVADDAVATYYEEHRDELEQACSAHILVETREDADEVYALLQGGADFAALAAERSTDPGSAAQGGDIGCVTRGRLVPQYEEALFSQPVGEIGEPVESDFGFHIIRVDSRGIPDLEDARDEIGQRLAQEVQQAFGEWFRNAVAAADVSVDPRYGTWNPQTAEIDRPSLDEVPTTSATTQPPEG